MSGLEKLAENGLLGLLLMISITALVFLYKEIKSLQEKRIQDLKESRDAIVNPLTSLQKTAERTLTIVENLKDNV